MQKSRAQPIITRLLQRNHLYRTYKKIYSRIVVSFSERANHIDIMFCFLQIRTLYFGLRARHCCQHGGGSNRRCCCCCCSFLFSIFFSFYFQWRFSHSGENAGSRTENPTILYNAQQCGLGLHFVNAMMVEWWCDSCYQLCETVVGLLFSIYTFNIDRRARYVECNFSTIHQAQGATEFQLSAIASRAIFVFSHVACTYKSIFNTTTCLIFLFLKMCFLFLCIMSERVCVMGILY